MLDPWWRLLWCHGHGKRLQAAGVTDAATGLLQQDGSPHRSSQYADGPPDGQKPNPAQSSTNQAASCGAVHCAADVLVNAPSSSLVRFVSTADRKCVPTWLPASSLRCSSNDVPRYWCIFRYRKGRLIVHRANAVCLSAWRTCSSCCWVLVQVQTAGT